MNDKEELKFKYDKNDRVLFVNRDFWTIDSVTVFERAETKSFPAYYVRLESGHITQLPEKWLFADKEDAVEKIIECLKDRLKNERQCSNYLQQKLDDFQSADFQMRYMGKTLKMGKRLFDAPWKQEGFGTVVCNDGSEVATGCTSGDAARIAHLPELYDALKQATRYHCVLCNRLSNLKEIEIEDLIENGCPRARTPDNSKSYVVSCVGIEWLELLRKVRDGK